MARRRSLSSAACDYGRDFSARTARSFLLRLRGGAHHVVGPLEDPPRPNALYVLCAVPKPTDAARLLPPAS